MYLTNKLRLRNAKIERLTAHQKRNVTTFSRQRLLHWFVLRQESKSGGDYHDVRGRTVSSYQVMALRLGLLTCARDSELPATPARGYSPARPFAQPEAHNHTFL